MNLFLNAAEMARLLGLDKSTVTKWIKQGKLKDVSRNLGTGAYRIPISSYEEFINKSKIINTNKINDSHRQHP